MQALVVGTLLTILFFSIRGIISLFLIIWGGKKIKNYFERKRKQKENQTEAEI